MNFPQLSTIKKPRFEYIALAFVFVWGFAHVVAYLPYAGEPGILTLDQVFSLLQHFYLWQAAAFLVVALLTALIRPAALGVISIAFLAASSAILLKKSHDAILIGKFCVFLFWFICTVNTSRMAVLRLASPRFASWGMSAGFLFSAMVSIGFFLGLIGVIYPALIAILAVLAAFPGLYCGIRQLSAGYRNFFQSLARLDFSHVFFAGGHLADSGNYIRRGIGN